MGAVQLQARLEPGILSVWVGLFPKRRRRGGKGRRGYGICRVKGMKILVRAEQQEEIHVYIYIHLFCSEWPDAPLCIVV